MTRTAMRQMSELSSYEKKQLRGIESELGVMPWLARNVYRLAMREQSLGRAATAVFWCAVALGAIAPAGSVLVATKANLAIGVFVGVSAGLVMVAVMLLLAVRCGRTSQVRVPPIS